MTDWPISDGLRAYLEVQYELLRVLGSGGMGVVLLARERALERMVAIKVLRPDTAADVESRERFRREARTAARLTHPHIVPLHTFGDVGGELYFVMGYVDGETLATRLAREGRLSTDETSRILAEIAEALDYAHRAGTVHRDLKPENILLEAKSARALLTDFGIARDIGAAAALTSTGVIVGTPHYMSPEQASGDRTIDGRSDIYALGVIGYRMVSGSLPFGGTSAREVIARQIAAAPSPLPTTVHEEAPALAAAIGRALAKAPEDRWRTAGELATTLRSLDAEGELGDTLYEVDGAVAGVALTSLVAGALFPLGWLVGIVDGSFAAALGTWAAVAGIASMVGVAVTWILARRGDPATRAMRMRISLRPPRWWSMWWPRRWRRPGDVWDRLPRELRAVRWLNMFSASILLPAQLGGVLWVFSPRGTEIIIGLLLRREQVITAVVGGSMVLVAGVGGLMAFLSWRLRRRFGVDLAALRRLQPLGNANPKWREPRYAAFLAAAPTAVRARSTESLLRDLQAAGVPLPDGILEARAATERALGALEREMRALREMVNAEEIQRLDQRLAALGAGDGALRAMLESQRELLARAESRIAELGGLRARLDAQQALLHQQLIALRDLAPSGGDLSEITGKLRAVNDDLRRLAEGFSSL